MSPAVGAPVVLIDEDFATFGATQTYAGVTVTWSDNDGTGGFERYTPPSTGTAPRGTDNTYDHDDDGGASTPDVTLVGAIEVNDDGGNVTLTGSFTLPGTVGLTDTLELDFGADTRKNKRLATVQIYNVTDSRDILSASSIIYGPYVSGDDPDWKRNDFSAALQASDAGDTIEIRFHEPVSSGGEGLQLTNLHLTAVPEPGTLCVLALGSLGVLVRRRRR